jgi:hypothetical protein
MKSKSLTFIILFLQLIKPAYSDSSNRIDQDFTENTILKTVFTSEIITAVITSKPNSITTGGISSPIISIGAFNKNGLLRICENPTVLFAENQVVYERTELHFKSAKQNNEMNTIVFSPLPDCLSLFLFDEPLKNQVMGIFLQFPFLSYCKADFLFEKVKSYNINNENNWFTYQMINQKCDLYNVAGRLIFNTPLIDFIIISGYSVSQLTIPGFYISGVGDLKADPIWLSIGYGYNTKTYISSSAEDFPESLGMRIACKFIPTTWLSFETKSYVKHKQIDKMPNRILLEEKGIAFTTEGKLKLTSNFSTKLTILFSYSDIIESNELQKKLKSEIGVVLNIVPVNEFTLTYRYQNENLSNEHTIQLKHDLCLQHFKLSSSMRYAFLEDTLLFSMKSSFHNANYNLQFELRSKLQNIFTDIMFQNSFNFAFEYFL